MDAPDVIARLVLADHGVVGAGDGRLRDRRLAGRAVGAGARRGQRHHGGRDHEGRGLRQAHGVHPEAEEVAEPDPEPVQRVPPAVTPADRVRGAGGLPRPRGLQARVVGGAEAVARVVLGDDRARRARARDPRDRVHGGGLAGADDRRGDGALDGEVGPQHQHRQQREQGEQDEEQGRPHDVLVAQGDAEGHQQRTAHPEGERARGGRRQGPHALPQVRRGVGIAATIEASTSAVEACDVWARWLSRTRWARTGTVSTSTSSGMT